MLKVHETITPAGETATTSVGVLDGVIVVASNDGVFPIPAGALDAVMSRFGAPLEANQQLVRVDTLDLGHVGEGYALHHVRHLARYDVIAKDYVVYERGPDESLCALSTTVAAALSHLARAARPEPPTT